MRESEIQAQILSYLEYHPWVYVWRNNSAGIYDPVKKCFRKGGKHSIAGVSDILGVTHKGQFLAIEVKSARGRTSIHQRNFLNRIDEMGGIAFIARSLDDVLRRLSKCGLTGEDAFQR